MFGAKAKKPVFTKLPPAATVIPPREVIGQQPSEPVSQPIRPDEKPSPNALMVMQRLSEAGDVDGYYEWTAQDAFEGTQVFGETGSGKTSGSGASIARALLKPPSTYAGPPFGGLVLTAKTTDLYDWIHPETGFLHQAGIDPRDPKKVIILGELPTPNFRPPKEDTPRDLDLSKSFNFLEYEYTKTGQAIFNLVQLFLTALESGSQGNTGQEDAYWMDALRQLLTNAIELVVYATGGVTLLEIIEVVQTAPTSREEARSKKWQSESSVCWKYLEDAQTRLRNEQDAAKQSTAATAQNVDAKIRNFRQIVNYWLLDFAGLADRTRSVVVSTFTAKVTGLTRWPLFELLCRDKTDDVDIVQATRDQKIVIINLPVKRYTEVGRFAQVLIKTVWQRGIERHPDREKPVFLWADEAQFFATREDMLFQTTARSSGCATVYLTQNICNYYAMMPGKDAKSAADALLGNLTTKIFHANGDPTTNDWAQRLFGRESVWLSNKSMQTQGGSTLGSSQTMPAPVLHVKDFATLRRGSKRHQNIVDAIVFRSGMKHADQKVTVLRTSFKQWTKGDSRQY